MKILFIKTPTMGNTLTYIHKGKTVGKKLLELLELVPVRQTPEIVAVFFLFIRYQLILDTP